MLVAITYLRIKTHTILVTIQIHTQIFAVNSQQENLKLAQDYITPRGVLSVKGSRSSYGGERTFLAALAQCYLYNSFFIPLCNINPRTQSDGWNALPQMTVCRFESRRFQRALRRRTNVGNP